MTTPSPKPHLVSPQSIVINDELRRRSYRGPNHQAENEALVALMRTLSMSPQTTLDVLATKALELCRAHSAGISIEEGTGESAVFRWHAVVGAWSKYVGGTLPRWSSPCGTVLDENRTLLMARPELAYPIPAEVTPRIVEVLLVPFHGESKTGAPVGTVWVISHEEARRFDREDLRLLESLAAFAGAAFRTLKHSRL